MAVRTPEWESELWAYLSNGDGETCPLYETCPLRQQGQWCVSDNKELLNPSHGSGGFDTSIYNFVEHVTPGRIFELVEKLAQRTIDHGKIHEPPVPNELVSLASKMYPAEVRLVPLKSHRGALWYLGDTWVIQLNENDPPARRRFTLFHEAFHIMAHCHCVDTPVFRKSGQEKGAFNELLAEYFASCTLMPREWVTKKWAKTKDLDRMAEIFNVPKIAMCLRLKTLHLM
jgi:predicted transcriptional regulator